MVSGVLFKAFTFDMIGICLAVRKSMTDRLEQLAKLFGFKLVTAAGILIYCIEQQLLNDPVCIIDNSDGSSMLIKLEQFENVYSPKDFNSSGRSIDIRFEQTEKQYAPQADTGPAMSNFCKLMQFLNTDVPNLDIFSLTYIEVKQLA